MTADPHDSPASAESVLAALADLARSDDPRDAPPAPTADAVRLAAVEVTLAGRLAAADRAAARWRRAAWASAALAAAVLVAAGVQSVRADRRADALGRALARVSERVERSQSRGPAGPRLWEADIAELAAAQAKTAETVAGLDAFADALLAAHLRQSEGLRTVRRDAAARQSALDELTAEIALARGEARRRFLLLAGAATDPAPGS